MQSSLSQLATLTYTWGSGSCPLLSWLPHLHLEFWKLCPSILVAGISHLLFPAWPECHQDPFVLCVNPLPSLPPLAAFFLSKIYFAVCGVHVLQQPACVPPHVFCSCPWMERNGLCDHTAELPGIFSMLRVFGNSGVSPRDPLTALEGRLESVPGGAHHPASH